MPNLYRVQHTFQDNSLLPRDRYVNTLHVADDGTVGTTDFVAVATALKAFYNATKIYFSAVVNGAFGTIKIYDMSDPPIRHPVYEEFTSYTGFGQVSGSPVQSLPSEVALVLTLRGDPVPLPVVRQSYTGRIFLGPLSVNAGVPTAGIDSRPAASAIGYFVDAAHSMADAFAAAGGRLQIYSPRRELSFPVSHLSMDNSWDTQRARGDRPTATQLQTIASGGGSPFPFPP